MRKIINIGNKKNAINTLMHYKINEYVPFDVKILNAHLTEINKLANKKLFKNDSLYINSFTLWEIMQDVGSGKKHNHHGLTEDDVYMAFSSLKEPIYVYLAKGGRFAIITTELSHFDLPLMIIVDTNASTKDDIQKTINKVVTIYPKDNVENLIKNLDKKDILYSKDSYENKK